MPNYLLLFDLSTKGCLFVFILLLKRVKKVVIC